MLSFFRVNALYQIFSLLFLLLLLRIPVYLSGLPLLIPEFQWMLVGEQISKGLMIYADVWDSTPPFAALVYALIDTVFGRAGWVYQAVALGFTAFQVVYFTLLLNRRGAYPERNYLPGLFYVLLLNISFDCFTLSPALMASTFLLLALGTIIRQMGRQGATDEVFEIGFYLSIATLFYPPAAIFIIWASISLLLFTGTTLRQHALTLFGFLFPFMLTALFFYLDGTFDSFNRNFLSSVFQIKQYSLNDFSAVLVSFGFPIIFSILGFLRVANSSKFINFQIRCQQIMALWFIAGILSVALMPYLAPMQFVIMVPCLAFFCVHYFSSFRKQLIAELIFLLLFGFCIFINYQTVYRPFGSNQLVTLTTLRLPPPTLPPDIRDRQIVVLGNGLNEYQNNFPATPYLNWNLARYDLENLDRYNNVINILRNFEQDPPEYIIDRQAVVPKLFQRIPALSRRYRQVGEGIYQRI